MTLQLREGRSADAPVIGDICYRAFKSIAETHRFIPDLPDVGTAVGMATMFLKHPRIYCLVGTSGGKVLGSVFVDERNAIPGIGPITVDPAVQNAGSGRALMEAVMRRSGERRDPGIRLVQAAYHARTLSLYLKLGFEARELLACIQGSPLSKRLPGYSVRPASAADVAACNRLCLRAHGHDRGGELTDALAMGTARVVERAERITGYATDIAFFSHAIGETNEDVKALIGAATAFGGPGFLVPTRNGDLLRWCLEQGLRITQTMTLMSVGLYNEPQGAWLPSIAY